jgi:murein DD-endopeptidase MepM/ murein hydrolase activator NlpD
MKKGTFSIIIVPHDLKKTRSFRVPYAAFYALVGFVGVSLLLMVVFVATYGNLLIRSRESSIYKQQIAELMKRQERMGELRRNLAQLRAMNVQIRKMLGLGLTAEDSVAAERATADRTQVAADSPSDQASMLRAIPTFWPVRGFITKKFNAAPTNQEPLLHEGVDIAVDRGTPIRASASGYVLEAGFNDTYGYYVQIDHGYGIKTLYAHADMLVVMKGERVAQGQTIAYSGNTGRSTAPHLHFQVTVNNVPVDPLKYLLQ